MPEVVDKLVITGQVGFIGLEVGGAQLYCMRVYHPDHGDMYFAMSPEALEEIRGSAVLLLDKIKTSA